MCTLTFVLQKSGDFILTSNRDESPHRATLPPQEYLIDGQRVIFPKDEVAGGTWIGLSSQKRVVNLLNGGFIAHTRKKTYRMSRGVVVLELLTAQNVLEKIESFNFTDIEPFTAVIIDWQESLKIIQLVWDGFEKHVELLPLNNRIWSASLLYTPQTKKLREMWFLKLLKEKEINGSVILNFHKNAGRGDKESALQIDRGFLKTSSITQITKKGNQLFFLYEDLLKQETKQLTFSDEI